MEGNEVFPTILQLEWADLRVGRTRNALEELHIGRGRGVVGRIQRSRRGREGRGVVRIQLTEYPAIRVIRYRSITLGGGRRIKQDAVDTLAGGRTKTCRRGFRY